MSHITFGTGDIMLYRDDIENIVKEANIDRSRFHEFSKFDYEDVLKKFYYSFADYERFATSKVELSHRGLHVRNGFECSVIASWYRVNTWNEYLHEMKTAIISNGDEKLFFILPTGFVYEGYADEIFHVLGREKHEFDYFIVSSKFDWFAVDDQIEECTFMYRK